MQKIRVTKRFHFEMAHNLYNYEGLCRSIHGHSYKLEVTFIGYPKNEPAHPKDGMVMDFGDIKQFVKTHVVSHLDHTLLINRLIPEVQQNLLRQTTERFIVVDFQPTTENMVVYVAKILQQHLPETVSLFSIRLYETATSFAEWYASDNE